MHGPHAQRHLVDDAEQAVAQPHQREQALRLFADDELLAVRAQHLELHDVRRELADVAGHRGFEAGRRDGAADRAVREVEAADELEPFVAQHVGELRQRDAGLHGDAVALDLQHAVHRGQIELRAAVGRDAARHRAAGADGAHGARIAPRVHQDLLDLGRRRDLDGRGGAGRGRCVGNEAAFARDGGIHERTDSLIPCRRSMTNGSAARAVLEWPATPLS